MVSPMNTGQFLVADPAESTTVRTREIPATAPQVVAKQRSVPGERAQIEALIAKEYVGLRLLLTRRIGDPNMAADILNDAICTTWEKWQAGRIEHAEQIAGYV